MIVLYKRAPLTLVADLRRNNVSQKAVGQYIQSAQRTTVNREPYIQQSNFQN